MNLPWEKGSRSLLMAQAMLERKFPRNLKEEKEFARDLADEFGVKPKTVGNIKSVLRGMDLMKFRDGKDGKEEPQKDSSSPPSLASPEAPPGSGGKDIVKDKKEDFKGRKEGENPPGAENSMGKEVAEEGGREATEGKAIVPSINPPPKEEKADPSSVISSLKDDIAKAEDAKRRAEEELAKLTASKEDKEDNEQHLENEQYQKTITELVGKVDHYTEELAGMKKIINDNFKNDGEGTGGQLERIQIDAGTLVARQLYLTPKTMMLFDIAVEDGYPGELSTYINDVVSKFYAKRGLALGLIEKREL